jgi:hypothetical protein
MGVDYVYILLGCTCAYKTLILFLTSSLKKMLLGEKRDIIGSFPAVARSVDCVFTHQKTVLGKAGTLCKSRASLGVRMF